MLSITLIVIRNGITTLVQLLAKTIYISFGANIRGKSMDFPPPLTIIWLGPTTYRPL